MASLEEMKNARLDKLKLLEEKGILPYPANTSRDIDLETLRTKFIELEASKKSVTIAGRVMALRGQGAIQFVSVFDGTSNFQVVLHAGDTDEVLMDFFSETVDIGDFVEFAGTCFTTKKGEPSLLVKDWKMLTKSLLPLPDKWHGLQDDDERFRKRYLDILTNTQTRDMFVKKAHFWQVMRNFLEERGFMAVETPMLELTTGGAETTPFATKHLDYDLDVFLRISVGELWQKRLMAAGFPKTYEIGRVFRNEGSSPNHLQEFTNCEFYWAYADYRMGMELVKDMYREIATKVFGTTVFETRGHRFDMADEWIEISYVDEILRQTNLDVLTATENEIKNKLSELNVVSDAFTRERMIDSLWKYCRKNIAGPAFVIKYPDFMQPLAKRSADNQSLVEQFQVLLGGAELGKGFSELNDPIDQRERFLHQQALAQRGDKEAMMADWEFVEMLEHGMPPACGFGAGERLFAFLVDKPIREVTLFPLMRPKDIKKSANTETQIVTIIINKAANLQNWQILNTTAHLAAAYAARDNSHLFFQDVIHTLDNKDIYLNIKNAILIKEVASDEEIKNLIVSAKEINIKVSEFTQEMIETTNDKIVIDKTQSKNYKDIKHLGIVLSGDKKIVESITRDIPFYS